MKAERPRVGLFVTCLVDLFRPTIGRAAVKLLEDAGCTVEVPLVQSCCGRPALNSGDRADARAIAQGVVKAFEGFDFVVVPSGSCGGMIARHYPGLFDEDPEWRTRAERLATRTHELVAFLVDVMGMRRVEARFDGAVTYHDACTGLGELAVRDQPRALLAGIDGLTLAEMTEPDVCCGSGVTFGARHPHTPNALAARKARSIRATGAGTLLAGDLGCLMTMAGKLAREGAPVKARHVAEVLAGMSDGPAIGEAGDGRKRERL